MNSKISLPSKRFMGVAAVWCGLIFTAIAKPETPPPAVLSDDDRAVIDTVLIDFLTTQVLFREVSTSDSMVFVAHLSLKEPHWDPDCPSYPRDLSEMEKRHFAECMEALVERNDSEFELSESLVVSQRIVVDNLEDFVPRTDNDDIPVVLYEFQLLENIQQKFPKVQHYVSLYLPSYSKNGRVALVQFWFAPSPHGARVTYLLKRTAGEKPRWRIIFRDFAYFA